MAGGFRVPLPGADWHFHGQPVKVIGYSPRGDAKQSKSHTAKLKLFCRGACHRARIRATRWILATTGRSSQADFSNSSRPISMRRISLVPAPIS